MPSTPSLIHKLKADFPDIIFSKTEQFSWSPLTQTVNYNPRLADAPALLLHELAHALLGHREYQRDVELLGMETAAWEKAAEIAAQYAVRLPQATAETHLDTYREWMHARSTCPACTATGYQTAKEQYTCPACSHIWRVNEARLCGLKRYKMV